MLFAGCFREDRSTANALRHLEAGRMERTLKLKKEAGDPALRRLQQQTMVGVGVVK
jgi:hypothetical protein